MDLYRRRKTYQYGSKQSLKMYGSFSSIGTISFIDRDENILGIIQNEKGKAIDLNKWLVKNMKRLKLKLPPPENQELQEEVESSIEKDDSIAMLSENSIRSSTRVKDIKIQAPIGYEYIDWNTRLLTPPSMTPLDMQYSSLNEYKEIPSLTDEEILKIIASEYKTIFPPCQKTNVDAIIIDTDHNCIYIYKLETFTESRSVEWAQEPWVAYKQGSNDAFLITNNNSSSNTKPNPQVSRQKNDTTSPSLISQRRNDSMEATATNTLIDDDGIGRVETKIIKAHSLNKSFECLKPNSSWLGAMKNKSSLDNNEKIKNIGYAKADASLPASAPPFKGVSRCETSATRSDDDRIPPDPWAINYEPGEWFTNAVKTIEIPNTANYSKCNACKSDGWKRCWRCSGRGTVSCITCNGTGKMSSAASSPSSSFTTKTPVIKKHTLTGNLTKDFCFSCSGRGRKRCQTCDVEGKLLCDVCKGYKGVKSYVKLTIKFTNHVSEYVHGAEEFPDIKLALLDGCRETIFEQSNTRIGPLDDFNEDEINEHSFKICEDHLHTTKYERILQQRHSLKAIPYTNVKFKDHNKRNKTQKDICIYGFNKQVYRPEHEGSSSSYVENTCLGCILN